MLFLRQSTASQEVLLGPFVDDTDGKTAETGLTIANTDIKLWVEGATTEASKTSGGATHIAAGRYYAVLDATDTATVGKMEINVHVAGALPVRREFHVLEEAVYDALFAASAAGYQVPIWAAAGSTVNLSGTTIATTQKVDVETIKTNPVVNAGTVTFPTGATLASTTNITAGTITTVTNLTNAPPDSSGVTTLLSRIPSGIFTGITSLAQWLGLIAGKQVGDTTARTELRATGAGSGTFDETTDSSEALRDRGDAAWTTASGFATAAELAKVPKSDGTATWNSTALASINGEADTALSDYGALKPTTAGRTLDVTATGAAGIDFANVENQNATVTLSGTTIADVTAVGDNVDTLLARIPATLFSGITSLAQWLGLIAGKQTGNTTARTELRATGAGSGTFDETTDSVEALRDRGDAAWTTASGFATATELAKVPKSDSTVTWNATALGSINSEVAAALGTYDGPTNAEMIARTLVAADYATAAALTTVDDFLDTEVAAILAAVDTEVGAIKTKTDQLTFTVANQVDSNALSGGGSGLDAAGVRAAVGLASANLDTQLGAIDDFLDTEVAAIKAKTDNLPASPAATGDIPSAATNATAVRSELTTELGRIDAAVSTRATPAQVATELATYDGPTNAEFEARTIVSASYATATALGTTDTAVQTLTTRVGIPAVSVSDDLAAVKTDTGNLVTRITSTLFSGITSLAQMLGIMAGKQVGDTTARNELRATGAGSGTFDETTDSMQAVRDRGDAAWTGSPSPEDITAIAEAVTTEINASGVVLQDASVTSAKFSVAPITGVATGFLEKQEQLHRSRYKKTTTTGTIGSGERKEYADDGTTVIVTQAWTDNGTTSTQNTAM